jgi:hypothetical protein
MIRRLFIIALMIPALALGDCVPAVRLKVGDVVKDCERIGLSEAKDLEVRTQLRKAEITEKIESEQTKLLSMKDLQLSNADAQTKNFQESDQRNRQRAIDAEERASRNLERGIIIGVVGTLLAVILSGRR